MVAFDSRPGVIQEFTWNLDRAAQAVADPTTKCKRQHYLDDYSDTSTVQRFSDGENGAAIHDSLSEAVRLLDLISRDYQRPNLLKADRQSLSLLHAHLGLNGQPRP